MPASNQEADWDAYAAEVSAGRMLWSGAAQSGHTVPNFSQIQGAILNDGTNPAGIASNQLPSFSQVQARAITVGVPTALNATNAGGGECDAGWGAPSTGATPDGYDVQFYQNGATFGAIVHVTSLSAFKTGYTNNASGDFKVRATKGAAVGQWSGFSNSVTITGGI